MLLTGGAGFIGSHLVRRLLKETDHSVVNADKLTYAGSTHSLIEFANHPRYKLQQVDIVNGTEVARLFRQHEPDCVIHLAAESHVDRSIDEPGEFIQTNIVGTYQLLHQALNHFKRLNKVRQKEFRFLHVSTDEVYGSLAMDATPFHEKTPYDPRSPYSASKASSDHLVRAWHATYGLPVFVTHCSNNYGPFQHPEKFVPVVILRALAGETIPVYGTGENIRDWLHVQDHVDALCAVISKGRVGETYNIGGHCELSNLELVRKICKLMDQLRPVALNPNLSAKGIQSYCELISFVTDRPGHDLRYAIDSSKIEQQLEWKPQETLADGLLKTVQWYLSNPDWCRAVMADTSNDTTTGEDPLLEPGRHQAGPGRAIS